MMKRFAILVFVLALLFVENICAEEIDYGFYLPDGYSIKKSPEIDYASLTDDPDALLVMETVHDWYLKDTWRKKHFDRQELVLFVSPYIFQKTESENSKEIFCVCTIDEYGLVQDSNGNEYFISGYSRFYAFDLLYVRNENNWEIERIRLPESQEELLQGFGVGTQGVNGVSDGMIFTLSEANYNDYIKENIVRYLNENGLMDVSIVEFDYFE